MKTFVLVLASVAAASGQLKEGSSIDDGKAPEQVRQCASAIATLAGTNIKLDRSVNPYYLRGDFDGDGLIDVAVALRSAIDDTKSGIAICPAKAPASLLGSLARGYVAKDDLAESVPTASWCAVSRSELYKILRGSKPPERRLSVLRKKLAQGKGEVIYISYEDGEGVIFLGYNRFEWYTLNSVIFTQDAPK